MRQVPLALSPDPLASFDSFLAGPNAAALEHLRSLVPPAAPVYLWGPSGSGRSHLLRALALHCQELGLRVGWFDGGLPVPAAFDPAWALLVLDDVDRFDPPSQQSAFAMLVEAQTHGVPWAAAGDRPPVDLPLRDDLRTRIGWGHVFALTPLDEAGTRAVLRREADRRGILLTDEVMNYLMTRHARDLGSLMGLLGRLDEFALSQSRLVTVPLLRQMLADPSVDPRP